MDIVLEYPKNNFTTEHTGVDLNVTILQTANTRSFTRKNFLCVD